MFLKLHKLISYCTLFKQSKTKVVFGNLQNYVCNPIYRSFQSIRIPFNSLGRWEKLTLPSRMDGAKLRMNLTKSIGLRIVTDI